MAKQPASMNNQKGLSELFARLKFLLMAIIIYRIGTHIPVPGFDPDRLAELFNQNQGTFLGLFNMFSGGALERLSILALGVMPYISASIIMQLLSATVPSLQQLKKEGDSGRRVINQYTRYGTVALATIQGTAMAVGFGSQGLAYETSAMFYAVAISSLVAGAVFLMWLGEQVTSRGIGNGISLIIFTGIVAELPRALAGTLELGRTGAISAILIVALLIMAIAVIAFIVFIERSQRRIQIQYPKRQMGNRMMGGESSHLPLKVNVPGVIPPIFASSLMALPLTAASFSGGTSDWLVTINSLLGRGQPLYLLILVSLIVFFAFFYTAIVFNPEETAENLRKNGGYVPGIRPGEPTANYLDFILTRLTVLGSAYLAAVCILPEILISQYSVPFYFGGTSLLIVVSVTLDTVSQVQSHLIAHQYEGLIKKSRLRGKSR
jgi:preprotein translocase subunit SecY